jgi:hypothetical protein
MMLAVAAEPVAALLSFLRMVVKAVLPCKLQEELAAMHGRPNLIVWGIVTVPAEVEAVEWCWFPALPRD